MESYAIRYIYVTYTVDTNIFNSWQSS